MTDHQREGVDPIGSLPKWHQHRLDLLTEALGDPSMTYPEMASLAIIARNDEVTIENLAAVIRRAMQANRFIG